MSLSAKQIAALDAWSKTQEPGAYGQVDGNPANDLNNLGTLLDNGKVLNDNLRDEYVWSIQTPAVAATSDYVLFTAPTAGTLQSVSLVAPTNWATTTSVGDSYTVAVRKYNTGVTANLTVAYDLQTGLAGGVTAVLPTNQSNTSLALVSATSNTVSWGVSGANVTLTVTVALLNAPTVGDFISVASGATNLTGATGQNNGIYKITSVDTAGLWLKATKQFGANPEAVAHVTAAAGDNTAVQLVRAGNAVLAAGDMIGLEFVGNAAAVQCPALTIQLRFRPA